MFKYRDNNNKMRIFRDIIETGMHTCILSNNIDKNILQDS